MNVNIVRKQTACVIDAYTNETDDLVMVSLRIPYDRMFSVAGQQLIDAVFGTVLAAIIRDNITYQDIEAEHEARTAAQEDF